jgi:hypothetical protein
MDETQRADNRARLNALTEQFHAASNDAMARHLRVYGTDELGADGYPFAWHAGIKDLIRELADHRCVRCGHPYRKGEHGSGEWSPCDEGCAHGMPARDLSHPFGDLGLNTTTGGLLREASTT